MCLEKSISMASIVMGNSVSGGGSSSSSSRIDVNLSPGRQRATNEQLKDRPPANIKRVNV